MATQLFAIPVFFICFRECLETSIIVSVLLAFLKRTLGQEGDVQTHKRLVKQVWWGVAIGFIICLLVGGGMIAAIYGLGVEDLAGTEDIWEGTFSIISSLVISVTGAALLRVSKLQDKWHHKLSQALQNNETGQTSFSRRFKMWSQRYAMFLLPFITVLREGLETVLFIGGVGLDYPASAFPLSVFSGFLAGFAAGYLLYRSGNTASLQVFLVTSTCFLYLVAAGLMSRGVWFFENNAWNQLVGGDASETGSGPGSYDIRKSVWHVNCCNPELNGGGFWGIFNGVLGWTNSATYGSVISYNLYWLVVAIYFNVMRYRETHDEKFGIQSILEGLGIRKTKWSGDRATEPDREPLLQAARENSSPAANPTASGNGAADVTV